MGTAGVLGGYCVNTAWLLKINHRSEIDYGTLAISVAAIPAGNHPTGNHTDKQPPRQASTSAGRQAVHDEGILDHTGISWPSESQTLWTK